MTNKVIIPPTPGKTIEFLDDSILEEYNESIKPYNEKARLTLGKFGKNSKNKLMGSSTFMNAYLENSGLLKDTKLSIREDLEQAIQNKEFKDELNRIYTDFGIAIWQNPETYNPNILLYENLIKQFKDRNIELGDGKLIYFSGLAKPKQDKNSDYGLVLELKDVDTKELKDSIRDINEFEWDFNKSKGLAGAYRSYGGWSCNIRNLANSGAVGRVVGVRGESQNFFTDEQWKDAFEKAGIPANYNLVRKHLEP